jgi:hypothetical protein
MLNDIVKALTTETEVVNYAKVNGYDAGGTEKLVKAWNKYQAEVDTSLDDILDDEQ